jgi:hypothetical protein
MKTKKPSLVDRIIFACEIERIIESTQSTVFTTKYVQDINYNNRTIQLPDLCSN